MSDKRIYALIDSDQTSTLVKQYVARRLADTDQIWSYTSAQCVLSDLELGALPDVGGVIIDPQLSVTRGEMSAIDAKLSDALHRDDLPGGSYFSCAGLHVIERLREQFPNIGIVCNTVYNAENDHVFPNAEALCRKAGATAYYQKPSDIEEVMADMLKTVR